MILSVGSDFQTKVTDLFLNKGMKKGEESHQGEHLPVGSQTREGEKNHLPLFSMSFMLTSAACM